MAKSEEEKTKEPSLFDFLNDITTKKKYLFEPDQANKNYSEFMINRGLAQHLDTILIANELNKKTCMTKQMHHDYLFYSVDAKPRYGKWAKADTTDADLLEYIKKTYCVNQSVAIEYLTLFDKTELESLKSESERTGGK